MWLVKKALIFLLQLLPFIWGQEFESTVIILKYEKGSLFHTGLCTGSQLDKGGVVTDKNCFNDFSKLDGAVGISRVSYNSHEVRFFKTCVFFEGWSVLTTSRPFTWQANSAARSKRSQPLTEQTSCIFDIIIHEPFIDTEPKKGNLMCDKELTAIFSQSGPEWLLRQMHSNFTVCLKRNNKKCKDKRLRESKFTEYKNKDLKKQIKLDLGRHPDRFRNKLVQMSDYDLFYLGYEMNNYHGMRVSEREQGKPIVHDIHVQFNPESTKALGTGSRDYNAFRVKRLIAPTPALSHNSQPVMNFRTNPSGNLTYYDDTTSDAENTSEAILNSAVKNPPQGLFLKDSVKVIRSAEDLKESSANTVTNTKSLLGNSTFNFTDIPTRTSKYQPSATKTKPNPSSDHLNNTETRNDDDFGKVRESDLPILRHVRKEESTTTIMKSGENYAQGKLSARKVDSTSNVTEIPSQLSTSVLAAEITQVKETTDGSKVRARDIPISRSEKQERSTTKITELSESYTKDKLSENKGDSVGVITDKSPHSPETVPQLLDEERSDDTDNDYGNVEDLSIPRSRLVSNTSSPTRETSYVDKTILQDYIIQRDGFGSTRNTVYKSADKDNLMEEEEDYDNFTYREGEGEGDGGVKEGEREYHSRASSQELHLTIILFTFIIRRFFAFTTEVL